MKFDEKLKKTVLQNSFKAFGLLIATSIIFILIISIFPLIGMLTVKDLPIKQIILQNLSLLFPITIISILISPVLALLSIKIKKYRLVFLMITAIFSSYLAIIGSMLMFSNFAILNNPDSIMLLSFWGFAAYSVLSIPLLFPAMFLFEKWTRKKDSISKENTKPNTKDVKDKNDK